MEHDFLRAHSSQVNMRQVKCARRTLFAFTLSSSCALDAYGWSSAELLHPSITQQEAIMSVVAWIALGVAAGLIGRRLEDKSGEGVLPDVLLGVAGAIAGGGLYYTFGPTAVLGFHLISHLAAATGSLAVLLAYYAIKRFR
jgi:uncharacterized membrane protein YeaQ/YmgE (transglycosylase-associated protein family)